MLQRQPRPLGFVRDHRADAFQPFEHIVHVDHRQILLANLLPLRAAGDAGDDAVAVPTFGNRRALLVIARVDQQMPMRVLLGEVRDAANHATAPARLRFDQHGHVLDAKLVRRYSLRESSKSRVARMRHECDEAAVDPPWCCQQNER